KTIIAFDNPPQNLKELGSKIKSTLRCSVTVKKRHIIIDKYVLEYRVSRIIEEYITSRSRTKVYRFLT
ncbi:MAG: hypothetical protein DRO23_11640, partial [Thermoprotei archaeon]